MIFFDEFNLSDDEEMGDGDDSSEEDGDM